MDEPHVSKVGEGDEKPVTESEEVNRLTRVSHELFDKLADYMQTELSGTKDTYAMLEVSVNPLISYSCVKYETRGSATYTPFISGAEWNSLGPIFQLDSFNRSDN